MLFYDIFCILIYLLLTIFVYKNLSQKYLTAISYANFSVRKILNLSYIESLKSSIVQVFATKYLRFVVIRLFFDIYRNYLFIITNYPTLLLVVWPFCFFPEAIPCPLKFPVMNLYYIPGIKPAAWILDIINKPYWPEAQAWFPEFPEPTTYLPSIDAIACSVWRHCGFEAFASYYFNYAPAFKSIPAIIIGFLFLGIETLRQVTVIAAIGFIFIGICNIVLEPDFRPSPSPIQAVKQFIRDVVSQKIDLSNLQGLQLPYSESMHLFYQSYLNVYQELYCFNYVAFFMLYQEKALLTLKAFHLGISYGVQFVAFF
jgi:hypothetical protein